MNMPQVRHINDITLKNIPCSNDASAYIIISTDVLNGMDEMKRSEILERYGEHGTVRKTIWYSEKEDYWYWSKPDSTKKKGFKNIKRRKKEDIEKLMCDYYLELEKQQQESQQKENMSLESLFYEFMSYKKKQVGCGTIKRMMADWNKFYKPYVDFINMPYKEIKKTNVDLFLGGIVDQHKPKDKAFMNLCGLLKQTFEYAVDAEYLDKSPYRNDKVNRKNIIPTRKKDNSKEVFMPEEQRLLLEEMEHRVEENPSNTAPLGVMLDFEIGVRQGELLAIRESDIINRKVHICRQLVTEFDDEDLDDIKISGFEIVNYTKSSKGDRWIPLSDRAIELIERIKEINRKYNIPYEDYLFVANGYIMSPNVISGQIKRGCIAVNIPVRRMHKVRKTFASILYKRGVSVSIISKLLGHEDEATTWKHYIFDLVDDETSDEIVLNALQGDTTYSVNPAQNVRQREKNIIQFQTNKKVENLSNIKVFRHSR